LKKTVDPGRSKRGRKSRNKGKVGEREVANLLKSYGYEARRGQQFHGGGDSPDVVHSMEGFHIEVKYVEKLGLYPAMEQADGDKKPEEASIVFHRRSRKPWVVVLYAKDFLDLMEELYDDD
jgi:Holliday junction resolvase|tara:strand:- start:3452 stop:3814 length:363 start_codon:yes stop_codon:yes gene_type:complete